MYLSSGGFPWRTISSVTKSEMHRASMCAYAKQNAIPKTFAKSIWPMPSFSQRHAPFPSGEKPHWLP